MSIILIALWFGRFLGASTYKQKGNKLNPSSTLLASETFKLLAQAGLLLYISLNENSILAMAASSFVYGISSAFSTPAGFIVIPQVVEKEYLKQANSWLSLATDIYGVIGPLFGATLVMTLGFKAILWFDSITFLFSLIFIYFLFKSHKGTLQPKNTDENAEIEPSEKLPSWVNTGLLSWFFCSILIGFMGVAGPALVIKNHSEAIWAIFLSILAIGSLIGSLTSLFSKITKIRWSSLHFLFVVALALQLLFISTQNHFMILYFIGFIASFLNVISGIYWDTMGQDKLAPNKLQKMASMDLLVSTTGIPIGMILFGITTWFEIEIVSSILLCMLAIIMTLPLLLKTSPKQ